MEGKPGEASVEKRKRTKEQHELEFPTDSLG
jgi:hypothetical protein